MACKIVTTDVCVVDRAENGDKSMGISSGINARNDIGNELYMIRS